MNASKKVKGFSLVSVAVSAALLGTCAVFYLGYSKRLRGTQRLQTQKALAQAYAAELIEAMRSVQSSNQLKTYLAQNRIDATKGSYYFCAPINTLDRTNNKILNEDPVTTLPASLLDANQAGLRAFRYYVVQVMDMRNMGAPIASWCANTFLNAPAVTGDLRLLVTVGVNWVPDLKKPTQTQEVVLSTVIPLL